MNWENKFLRCLQQTISAGVTLFESFELLRIQETDPRRQAQLEIAVQKLSAGLSLTQALKQAKLLTSFELCLVETGEQTGSLVRVLAYLVDTREKLEKVEREVKAAVVYPTISLMLCLLACVIMLPYLLRGQLELLRSFDVELPLISRFLVLFSSILASVWFWVLLGLFVVAAVWILRAAREQIAFRRLGDRLVLATPLGRTYQDLAAARFARPFALALASGLPLTDNLQLSLEASGNTVLADSQTQVIEDVLSGSTISQALEETGFFRPTFLAMVTVGEEAGKLPITVRKGADLLEFELMEQIQIFSSLLQPLALVIMGAVVGFFAIGLLLPTTQILENL